MQYTRLGNSGLRVSRIALGCMSFGDTSREPWALGQEAAEPLFRRALELGITFWDTANIYGYGTSEEVTGHAIRTYAKRDDIVLATKLHAKMSDDAGGAGLSRRAIFQQIDASLARLGTDWVDLYQIHRFDPQTPIEETMEALHDLIKSGKVRYIGASSMYAWQFAVMQGVAERNGWTKFVSMQDQYSLVYREEEREMFGLLAHDGAGAMPWAPLAGGRITRPWGDFSTKRSTTNAEADFNGRPILLDSDEQVVDAVEQIAQQRGVSMAQVAMAWVLHNPVVDAPIVGATKTGHLDDAAAAVELRLSPQEIESLEEHYQPRQPTYF